MEHKEKLKTNLKKAKSLIITIERMVEEDRYCPEIMQQILAVIGLLRSVHKKLMEKHLKGCFAKVSRSEDEGKKNEMINELLKVIELYRK